MIRKLISRVFGPAKSRQATPGKAAVIVASRHGVRPEQLSSGGRRTVEGLQQAGFEAYIVGGAVRDMLLGRAPKDFDVATNATPEQVRATFRRSRIIGRRFQIVHVMMGGETIEVTTFRGSADQETDAHGRILRDNVWGTMEEDALRRDFTVNALYYDPKKDRIVDYHHGVADLEQKTLRVIGDASTRYREDPVRMLRAVRFAAKLGLNLDRKASQPIRELADLLENVPAARIFDEMMKLLTSGHSVECLRRLREEGLHHGLMPLLDIIMDQPLGEKFVNLALSKTDDRVREGKPLSPGYLFATLLWHEVLARWEQIKAKGEASMPALHQAMDEVIDQQCERTALTRRIAGDIKDILALQPRFEARSGRRPFTLLTQPRFKAGFDFLLLRAEAGEVEQELADWWSRFMHADEDERADMLLAAPKEGPKKRRRRRKPAEAGAASAGTEAE
ncbi:MAG TPA: polynucleotide adenylyltransferase PcnB [Rhodocyclaceae bacterium]|nr:polynucleotide adenylyltransferase PcnB [Rhodocyclaceae bacterium]